MVTALNITLRETSLIHIFHHKSCPYCKKRFIENPCPGMFYEMDFPPINYIHEFQRETLTLHSHDKFLKFFEHLKLFYLPLLSQHH